jgi:hypothetical protein
MVVQWSRKQVNADPSIEPGPAPNRLEKARESQAAGEKDV